MATLAASLVNLRSEINARWPHRDKRSDGWIGDAAHQQRQSDHNPDSHGIVHAIDVDRDGIDPMVVVNACLRDDWPTTYVIFNRTIWSATHEFKPRPYTGDNPHTDHIHVSIRYGTNWESAKWHWGIATVDPELPAPAPVGPTDEMNEWRQYFDVSGGHLTTLASGLITSSLIIANLKD